jgi:hypothetical protein
MGISFRTAIEGIPMALLQGSLVLMPRAAPFARLRRLRSPRWAVLLPGSIIFGTFGMLLVPSMAFGVVFLAAVTTPVLALMALLFVVRVRRLVLPIAVASGTLAALASGAGGRDGTSVITALACLTVGTALHRLIPGRWLLIGVLAMSTADVTLLGAGVGYHQTALLAAAMNSFPGPRFSGARIGAIALGYPDLVLAALLGASVAGTRYQARAATLLAALAIGLDSLLTPGVLLPATVPIALVLIIVSWRRRADHRAAGRTADAWAGQGAAQREMMRRTRREMCPRPPPAPLVSPVTPSAVMNTPASNATAASSTGQCSVR